MQDRIGDLLRFPKLRYLDNSLCPVDAVELTALFDLTGASREEMIFDKEKLLSVYDATIDKEPMRSRSAPSDLVAAAPKDK